MTIELNHTIVPTLDKEASARFFARIFGLSYEGCAYRLSLNCPHQDLTPRICTHSSYILRRCQVLDCAGLGRKTSVVGIRCGGLEIRLPWPQQNKPLPQDAHHAVELVYD